MRVLGVLVALFAAVPAAAAPPPLIPLPVSVDWRHGSVPIGAATRVDAPGEAAATGAYLKRTLELKDGRATGSRIRLALIRDAALANPEGYRLRAAGREVTIEASDPHGLFNGVQTLRQLITEERGVRSVPAVEISDAPRFRWRGLLLDVSRHFFAKRAPVDYVYFDYPQGPGEPGAPWEGNDNGPTSISKILSWEPRCPTASRPRKRRALLGSKPPSGPSSSSPSATCSS